MGFTYARDDGTHIEDEELFLEVVLYQGVGLVRFGGESRSRAGRSVCMDSWITERVHVEDNEVDGGVV